MLSTVPHRVADALGAGAIDEGQSERLPSPDAAALLRSIKGIGQWTAVVILLRARNLTLVGRPPLLDVETLLDTSD
jgi:3-methyladenine DNA glycosylase/8-oxoguanine DNA glycosylase